LPTIGEALEQARRLVAAGQLAQADAIYRQLLAVVPDAAELWHEAGLLQMQAGRPDAAIEFLQKAASIDPHTAAFHSNLAAIYRALKRGEEAVAGFRRAVECDPTAAEFRNNLALALKDAGRQAEALAEFDEALRLRPDYGNGYFNRGNLLLDQGRLDEAIDSYRRAASLNPEDAGAHCQLGVAFYDSVRMDEALDSFARALALQPRYPEVRRNRALIWLARGDYAQGWRELEWRVECADFGKRTFSQPSWDGSPLEGRTLLAYAEQGLGDTLQFVRYVPLVERAGGQVKLEVQPRLRPLLAQSGFGSSMVEAENPGHVDVQCPLMTLAGHLPDGSGTPFWPGPYLSAEPGLTRAWRNRLRGIQGFKVGIAWAGSPKHPHDRFRSVRLGQFAPLARVPGVHLVSLQKGWAWGQMTESDNVVPVIDLGETLDESTGAFMETAAALLNLDLVITVDTAIAHLAGGLGVNVWVPLQFSPDWRWSLAGETTPWYPTMRLFRQRELNQWPGVFEQMAEELSRLAAGGSG
jgi:tetratricopeptide (TPR) repeat protein